MKLHKNLIFTLLLIVATMTLIEAQTLKGLNYGSIFLNEDTLYTIRINMLIAYSYDDDSKEKTLTHRFVFSSGEKVAIGYKSIILFLGEHGEISFDDPMYIEDDQTWEFTQWDENHNAIILTIDKNQPDVISQIKSGKTEGTHLIVEFFLDGDKIKKYLVQPK